MEMNTNTLKIGFIISMYDEIEQVSKNIEVIKKENGTVIVIQSDPKNSAKLLDKTHVDYYELLPDLAGSKEQYVNERSVAKGSTIPSRAITRNYSHAFNYSKNFDVDWWISILGDVSISNLNGIKNLIRKMIKYEKSIGVTRAIGQTFYDNNEQLTRFQSKDISDFMPQFFIVKADLVRNSLFNDIKITNRFASEQCLGDEVNRFCNENSTKFNDVCFLICDYAYPEFIKGLKYNVQRPRFPRKVHTVIKTLKNFYRNINLI